MITDVAVAGMIRESVRQVSLVTVRSSEVATLPRLSGSERRAYVT
jgi:hypothetical protein